MLVRLWCSQKATTEEDIALFVQRVKVNLYTVLYGLENRLHLPEVALALAVPAPVERARPNRGHQRHRAQDAVFLLGALQHDVGEVLIRGAQGLFQRGVLHGWTRGAGGG